MLIECNPYFTSLIISNFNDDDDVEQVLIIHIPSLINHCSWDINGSKHAKLLTLNVIKLQLYVTFIVVNCGLVLFTVFQVDFKCDVVLDAEPVTPEVVSCL